MEVDPVNALPEQVRAGLEARAWPELEDRFGRWVPRLLVEARMAELHDEGRRQAAEEG